MSKVVTTFAADDQGMVATINKIERETKGMSNTMQKTENQFKVSFSSMAIAGAGFAVGMAAVKGAFALVKKTVDEFGNALELGGRLSDLSARTGEAAGNLLLLERAFDNSGAGADKVGGTINKLQRFLVEAESGTKKNVEAMAALGLTYSNIMQMSPADQFELIAQKISEIGSPAERAALAMQIFGKSGGELLPLFNNFAGEIANARSELGSMTDIMNQRSEVFDTVSDKIQVIKGKVMEFAAGILDRIIPALELFTTKLASFDAAGFGRDLADAFLGGQEAMNGFNSALQALKLGEFELSFKIIMVSIQLQIKTTFNQIILYAKSTFQGLKAAVPILMEPILFAIQMGFELLFAQIEKKGYEMSQKLYKKLSFMVPDFMLEMQDKYNRTMINQLDEAIHYRKRGLEAAYQSMGRYAEEAGMAWGKAFDKSMQTTKPLIDTTNNSLDLTALKMKAAAIEAERMEKALEGAANQSNKPKSWGWKPGDAPTADMEMNKRIALPLRKSGDDLKKWNANKQPTELTELDKLKMQLIEVKSGRGIDIFKKDFQQELDQGRFKKAQSTLRRIENKQLEDELRINEKGERDRRNIADIARKEGIKTFGKTNEEIRKEILQKRRDEALKKAGAKFDAFGQPIGEKGAAPARKPEEMLLDVVKAIKALVEKIEPKLPTHALAL